MAHFAELDEQNKVLRVVVVDNKDTSDGEGNEVESIGAAYLQNLLGGRWIQTSYNKKFRKNYAGIGYIYDEVRDAFYPEKPFPSFVFDEQACTWAPPIPCPSDGASYYWDEPTASWVKEV